HFRQRKVHLRRGLIRVIREYAEHRVQRRVDAKLDAFLRRLAEILVGERRRQPSSGNEADGKWRQRPARRWVRGGEVLGLVLGKQNVVVRLVHIERRGYDRTSIGDDP